MVVAFLPFLFCLEALFMVDAFLPLLFCLEAILCGCFLTFTVLS